MHSHRAHVRGSLAAAAALARRRWTQPRHPGPSPDALDPAQTPHTQPRGPKPSPDAPNPDQTRQTQPRRPKPSPDAPDPAQTPQIQPRRPNPSPDSLPGGLRRRLGGQALNAIETDCATLDDAAMVFVCLRLRLAFPRPVYGLLSRWRWFSIICDCALPFQGPSKDALAR